jgi:hypothetical protein
VLDIFLLAVCAHMCLPASGEDASLAVQLLLATTWILCTNQLYLISNDGVEVQKHEAAAGEEAAGAKLASQCSSTTSRC